MAALFIARSHRIGATSAHATMTAFASQIARFVLHVAVGIALARLVAPQDFGLFGIAVAATSVLQIARGPMMVPVVQREWLTREELEAVFWFNVALGLGAALIACLIAPLVAYFYGDQRLGPIIRILALVFVIGGMTLQHVALLQRQMRFGTLALCEVGAFATACVAAVATALHGAGYWSLILFELTREFVQAALLVLLSGWIPRWQRRRAAIGSLLRFGGLVMVFDLLGYLNSKADNLIVAWFLGPTALGFYDKAYQWLFLPVNQINLPLANVAHATLSRLANEPARYRAYVTRALLLSTTLGMPVTTFLYANADTIVADVLGRQWLPTVPVFRALAPAAFLMSVTACVGWIFLSLGRARRQLPWAALGTTLTVAAFFVGASWGIVGVAYAFSVVRTALCVPTLAYTCHGSPVDWRALVRAAARPAFASLMALALSAAVDSALPGGLWSLPRNAAVFGVTYTVSWIAVPGGRVLAQEHLRLARSLWRHA